MNKLNKALIEQHALTMARQSFQDHNKKKKEKPSNDPALFVQTVAARLSYLKDYQIASVDTFKIPKTKNQQRLFIQLLRHCYVKYPIKERWYSALLPLERFIPQSSTAQWSQSCGTFCAHPDGILPIFLTLASGGSVHKKHFSKYLTKKETHAFITCPHSECTLEQALIYAIAKCAGASEGIALRLARSRLSEHLQITQPFWLDNIRFFAKDAPESMSKINDICDFLRAQKIEEPNFTIIGRSYTTKTLERRTKDWHYALARSKAFGHYSWNHCKLPEHIIETPSQYSPEVKDVWLFKQITTSQELAKEGTAMRHCVSSYVQSCRNGHCAIWSVQLNGARKLTIELQTRGSLPSDMNIVQVRGLANRLATPSERRIVEQWANTFNLSMQSKYLFRY